MRSLWIACSKLRSPSVLYFPWILTFLLKIFLCPHPIWAVHGDAIAGEGHTHPPLDELFQALEDRREVNTYESEFIGFDRSIIGRAEEDNHDLANNAPGQLNISQGDTHYWKFSNQSLFGPKSPSTPGLPSSALTQSQYADPDSPDERTLYISLTTCLQPTPKTSSQNGPPSQLEVYVSTQSANKRPSATRRDNVIPINDGFGSLKISAKTDVYFAISAPENKDFTGVYNYQLTASIDTFFAFAFATNESNLNYIDSDINSALLYTKSLPSNNSDEGLGEQWMSKSPPFSIFVQNKDNPSIQGMQKSVCALQSFADVWSPAQIDSGMTTAGDGLPKQQFHVKSLNASSTYHAILAIVGNSTDSGNGVVGGGGRVWGYSSLFNTKSDGNCALLFNLTFCTTVAYAAPANLNPDVKLLGQKYDDYASNKYKNFSRSLQQIPCDTTSSAKYSLAVTCDHCDKAYREWLCAVTIPRCEDFSNNASYLYPRAGSQNFTNETLAAWSPQALATNKSRKAIKSSRNPMIDDEIIPGPYREVLPCSDLCYSLVRSCPASLQFVCPLEGHGLEDTYGTQRKEDNDITCSTPMAGIPTGGVPGPNAIGVLASWIAFSAVLAVMIT